MYHQMQGNFFEKRQNGTIANFKYINQTSTPVDLKVYFIVLAVSFFKSTCPLRSETAKPIVDSWQR